MNRWELWRLSKVVHNEVFFQGQIQAAGAHKARILQRYEKNMKSAKNFALISSLVTSMFMLITTIFPMISILYITNANHTTTNIDSILFATSTSYAIYFLINTVFIFVFGLFSLMSFTTGDSFKFLRFLPLSDNDLQQISLFTFIRMYYIELPVFLLALPIESFFLTKSIIPVIALLLSNFINIALVLYILIITSRFLSLRFFKSAKITKFNIVIKIMIAFAYMTVFFSFSLVTQSLTSLLATIYTSNVFLGLNLAVINNFLPLIFFPFTTGYIVSFSLLSLGKIPLSVLEVTSIGFIILLLVTIIITRKGNSVLRSFANENVVYSMDSNDLKKSTNFKLTRTGSQRAFMIENLKTSFREFNSLLSLMFVFIIPLVSIVTNNSSISKGTFNPFVFLYIYAIMIPFFLRNGFYTFEMNLGGILQSLPFKDRDFFRSRQYLMVAFACIPILIIAIIAVIWNIPINSILTSVIIGFFLNFVLITCYLLLFTVLFGKINYRYTLFAVNQENKVLKYILMVIIMAVLFGLELGTSLIFSYFLVMNIIIILVLELLVRGLIK